MAEKSIKLNYVFNIVRNVLNVIFPLITAPYIARVLEPDGVGLFNFATTYATYFSMFAALGAGMYGIREIAKERDSLEEKTRILSEITSLVFLTTCFCTVIFVLSIFLVPQLNENYIIFLIAGFGLYLTPFRIDWFYQGIEEFGYITLRSFIIKVLSVIALFLFVKEKDDLWIMITLSFASTTLNEIWNFIKLFKSGVRPYFTLHFRQHIKPMLVLFASVVAISVYTMLDTLMLGFIKDYGEVGFYNNANHIAKALLPVTTSLAAVVMPRLSYYTKTGEWDMINRLMEKSLSVVSFLSFPIAMALILVAPVFIPMFYGELFYGAILPLQILSGVVIAIGLNNLLGIQILVGLGKDKQFLWAVLVGTFSNFFLNLTMIPALGANGAALSSVIAESLILFVEIWLVRKYTKVKLSINKEFVLNFIVPFGFIPLFYVLDKLCHGWTLVFVFSITGFIYYVILQYLLKNTTLKEFINNIVVKLRLKKS